MHVCCSKALILVPNPIEPQKLFRFVGHKTLPKAPKVHQRNVPGLLCQPGTDAANLARVLNRDWKATDQKRGTARQRGYSKAWERLRYRKLLKNPLCETCFKTKNLLTPASEVHHINPVRKTGKTLVPLSQLKSLCHSCHQKEEAQLKRKEMYDVG